uniref:p18 n=1 Tax=Citrus tristeza virus TaxID=12162 RepID=A0A4Y5USK3_9CLOS|nr:p18 [Citrus tristeza virus]
MSGSLENLTHVDLLRSNSRFVSGWWSFIVNVGDIIVRFALHVPSEDVLNRFSAISNCTIITDGSALLKDNTVVDRLEGLNPLAYLLNLARTTTTVCFTMSNKVLFGTTRSEPLSCLAITSDRVLFKVVMGTSVDDFRCGCSIWFYNNGVFLNGLTRCDNLVALFSAT